MTQKAANEVVKETCEKINENNLPTFVTDGKNFYKQALLDRYSYFSRISKNRKKRTTSKAKTSPFEKIKICSTSERAKRRKIKYF